ncbi:MAG: MFS transporter [Myxococcota bacterium]|nr:MFS transporter [Myxococcota bacterium]
MFDFIRPLPRLQIPAQELSSGQTEYFLPRIRSAEYNSLTARTPKLQGSVMKNENYLSAPVATKNLPKGIPYIIGNEAAERFSFYGMKGILIIFMHQYLHLLSDNPATKAMGKAEAVARYHDFTFWVYLTPILGALLADTFLGKYRTILTLSIVYCLGHFCLALMGSAGLTPEGWLMSGLALIALGSGGIKPCVSAHVGDQFGRSNKHWISKVFGWFYISINVGAFISTILTPLLLEHLGPHWAFGVPGVLMAIATVVFWMGRKVFVHIPPPGMKFIKETFSVEGILVLLKLGVIFVFVAVFWALFDQTGSSWVLQAEDLNRNWLGIEWLSSQIQSINPIMIVLFVPLFNGIKAIKFPGIYALISKFFPLSPLRKVSIGLFVMTAGFATVSVLQSWIDQGQFPSIGWQVSSYAILTASEVMVSITCLEFAYTQAPRAMKSVVMALFLMSVSLGNFFTAAVNSVIQVPGQLEVIESIHEAINTKKEQTNPDEPPIFTIQSQADIKAHIEAQVDLQGNPIVLEERAEKLQLTLVGFDSRQGGLDDIIVQFDKERAYTFTTSQDDLLKRAYQIIEQHTRAHENTLPKTEEGTALLKDFKDGWGSTLQYRMENRNRFRITSLGADQKYMTPHDIVWISEISRPKKDSSVERPYNWREKRIIELHGEKGEKQIRKERGGIDEVEFSNHTMIGGQTNLEGAAYFWFFTKLMLGTAIGFVFVAFLYRPKTYLQEEDESSHPIEKNSDAS